MPSAPAVLAQRVGLRAGWRCGLTRGLLYESNGMSPVWSGGVCSRFALPVRASYPSCVKNVEIPLGCMKSGSCDLGVFPLQKRKDGSVPVKVEKSKDETLLVKVTVATKMKPKRLNGNNVRMSDLPEFAAEKW